MNLLETGSRGQGGFWGDRWKTNLCPQEARFWRKGKTPQGAAMDDSIDLDFQNVSHQRSQPPC